MKHSYCALWILLIIGLLFVNFGCEHKSNIDSGNIPPLEEEYLSAILLERAEKDSALEYDPHSPFNRDPRAIFSPLKSIVQHFLVNYTNIEIVFLKKNLFSSKFQ